ncbi:hypothetical protein ABB37_08990 [Leptomonas pyrrhocoris]|uniref:Uncharacterized protein n=1 Tax=Leptomonas pyrrhocoris TaxID=157538 RepID=A0A0M9FRZ1_LEPPY|nr:hypothetical protein ABB37_08990 [Leptomonas pyrrhocoris]KPA74656.1 hypothetical protein ABB37_08990 [Leptomonas pyrrhocoris]|eukprot:XP_015653095.1 hypothetical protein ABB37_08990 [Leptomonas pyrrhocoris]
MALARLHMLKCTVLPVGKVISLAVARVCLVEIQTALSKQTACAAEAFALYVQKNERLVALTSEIGNQDSVYALLRCRGGGKGGFRKQLEKKGREFARAKMKEKRNSVKGETKKEATGVVKRKEHTVTAKLPKAETSTTRALVKQGLAFVMDSYQKGASAS